MILPSDSFLVTILSAPDLIYIIYMSFVIPFSTQCKQFELVFQFRFRFCGMHHVEEIINHLHAEMESIQYWLPHRSENLMLFLVHLDIQGSGRSERRVQSDMHQFFNYLDAFDEFHIRIRYNRCNNVPSSTYHLNLVGIDYEW